METLRFDKYINVFILYKNKYRCSKLSFVLSMADLQTNVKWFTAKNNNINLVCD